MKSEGHIKDVYTLTPMQEGMLFHTLYAEDTSTYFQQISYRLSGEPQIPLVEKTLNALFHRHDILRTAFVYENVKRPVQVVLKKREAEIYHEDLRTLDSEAAKIKFIEEFKEKDKKRSFDLTREVLLRVAILQLENKKYEIIWSFHHILMDGWSSGILIAEFFEIYNSFFENRVPRLPDVKSFGTYIQWLEQQDKEEVREYWQKYLAGYEEAAVIPRLKALETGETGYKNEHFIVSLAEKSTADLKQLTVKNQVSLNAVIQTVWGILLAKYNRTRDVVYGTVVSGRPSEIDGVENMIGLFINTIPVRITYEEETCFNRLMQEVWEYTVESAPYHFNSLAEIQAQSSLKQNLIDHILIFENYPVVERLEGTLAESGGNDREINLEVTNIEVFEQTNYDFNLLINQGNRVTFIAAYNGYIYDRDFVERTAGHFLQLLDQVLDNEKIGIKELTVLSEKEKKQILYDFNNTFSEYPEDLTLHRFFQQTAERIPDSAAIVSGDEQLTYKALHEEAGRLAGVLKEKGIKPDMAAAIMIQRSLEMFIGILGVLKAGGAYLPIDPVFPKERIRYMLEDSRAPILLSSREFISQYRDLGFDGEIIDLEDKSLYSGDKSKPGSITLPSHLAYLIYTSGSTGKPKGVMIEHGNVMNFNKGITSRIAFRPGNVILALTTISFDIFVLESLLPLLNGLKIIIANEAQQKDPGLLETLIMNNSITMLQLTPSTLTLLDHSDKELHCLQGVKELMVGGEAFPAYLFKTLKDKFNGRIYNMYGPTETTVWSTIKDLTDEEAVDIGTPIANTRVYILDRNDQPQPVGITGELCIGGDGTARGYSNDLKLNREKFIENPFVKGDRIYRTGDLARWLPGSRLEFLGRIDCQVKIRGFRIETGEIESILLKREEIKEALVVSKEDKNGSHYLCAYYISSIELAVSELREYLSNFLPDYMIPSYFIISDNFPLTPNGKIDRKSLPEPGIKSGDEYAAPENEMQKELVEIWSEVLDVDKSIIGIDTNFFELGGHSLKAVILISRCHKAFNVRVPLSVLFKKPNIKNLAGHIRGLTKERYISIMPAERREYYPLSSAQQRLYFIYRMNPEMLCYNFPQVYFLEGEIAAETLEASFKELIRRHECFRTSFKIAGGHPVQRVDDEVAFSIEYDEAKEKNPRNIVEGFLAPFDLSAAPIFRVGLIKIGENKHILIIDMHHVITDYLSTFVLINDLIAFYKGKALPPLRLQYTDFSQWHHKRLKSREIKKQEEYWLEVFKSELPALDLPTDYTKSSVENNKGDDIHFIIEKRIYRQLDQIGIEAGTTLYAVLLAVYYVLLHKYTGQEDIVIGTPTAGRNHEDLEKIIGVFVNMLAMRNNPLGTGSFMQFLEKVKENTIRAVENQEFQFDELVKKIGVSKNSRENPLLDCVFNFMDNRKRNKGEEETIPHLRVSLFALGHIESPFDLLLTAIVGSDSLNMTFTYPVSLFKRSTIEKMKEDYMNIIRQVIENNDIKLSDITLSYDLMTVKSSALRLEKTDFNF